MAQRPPPTEILGIFVKAPAPGQVKTRLALEIGPDSAAELYHRLGRMIVARSGSARYSTVVWFAPPDGGDRIRSWLHGLGVERFLPQRSGGLGQRLAGTFARHFREGARRVVVIGSDCPDVDRALVTGALAALDDHDLVLGPSVDGGFYLIGLTAPAPGLFRRVTWSSPAVYRQTLGNAARLGLRIATLPALRDIDTAADARSLGWLSSASS